MSRQVNVIHKHTMALLADFNCSSWLCAFTRFCLKVNYAS